MHKLVVGLAAGLGMLKTAAIGLPSAHADSVRGGSAAQFAADIDALGLHNGYDPAAQLDAGVMVCNEITNGWMPHQAGNDMASEGC